MAQPATPATSSLMTKGEILWLTDLKQALGSARSLGRGIFVFFQNMSSPASNDFEKNVLTSGRVQNALAAKWIPVVIDVRSQANIAAKCGAPDGNACILYDQSGKVIKMVTLPVTAESFLNDLTAN
jgi:hypothetical protein